MALPKKKIDLFRNKIYSYYRKNRRDLPWRETVDPYHILVSEIMLQQTQVVRVLNKYSAFIEKFPTIDSLVSASIREIYSKWQGLGYNRRAVALKKCVEIVQHSYNSVIPGSVSELQKLPGIGKATASAISAFAFNEPAVFIETNIRTVFIHCFFPEREQVADNEILPLIAASLDTSDPRNWYYALMDYGVMLKKKYPGLNTKSAHYAKQTPFEGSDRQIRGRILKELVNNQHMTEKELTAGLNADKQRVRNILAQLTGENFIAKKGGRFSMTQ